MKSESQAAMSNAEQAGRRDRFCDTRFKIHGLLLYLRCPQV
jgi:hypothetical protein